MKQSVVSKDSVVLCKCVARHTGSCRVVSDVLGWDDRAQSGLLVFYPVLSTGRRKSTSRLVSGDRRNVKKKKKGGRDGEKCGERKRGGKSQKAGVGAGGLRQKTGCRAGFGSAGAVGGRRLSSRDAHNQFFCKGQRGTTVRTDGGKRTEGGAHAQTGGTAHPRQPVTYNESIQKKTQKYNTHSHCI